MSISKKFNIELRYANQESAPGIHALAQELSSRGHSVTTKSTSSRIPNIDDITRSAANLKGIAETGVQILKDTIDSFVSKATDVKGSEKTDDRDAPKTDANGFDTIGPQGDQTEQNAKANESTDDNSAIVVTSQSCLNDAKWDAMRIGLIAETGLREDWLPSKLDAIVVPHPAFRPYLETVAWPSERIFEGGYPVSNDQIPDFSHQDALTRFNINPNLGRIVIVMASGFRTGELQTLLTQISLLPKNLQIFFYHASDNAKADALRSIAQRSNIPARMFGKSDKLANYLAMADLVIANAVDDDLSALEAAGIPTVISAQNIHSPIADFLVHEEAARCVNRIFNIASATNQILSTPQALDLMRGAAATLAQRASVPLCADAIEAALDAKDAITNRPDRNVASCGFEVIGTSPLVQNPFAQPQTPTVNALGANPQNILAPSQLFEPIAQAPQAPIMQPTVTLAPQVTSPNMLTPSLSFSSKKELEREYTKLIQAERSVNKALDAASDAVNQWELRLDLAKQNARDDLIASAVERLNAAKNEEMTLMNQKQSIDEQKRAMRLAARNFNSQTNSDIDATFSLDDIGDPWQNDPLEEEFKRLQAQNALQALRDKIRNP